MAVDPERACRIVENIVQLWLDDQFVDVQIHVGDIQFKCHRFMLCASSTFFKVLLDSKVKVEAEHQIRQVTIRGISPGIFQLILESVYKGENGITPDNMIQFWRAAHQLQITFLVSECETFVLSHLSQENFVNIYESTVLLQSVNMIKATCQFVAENFENFKDLEILLQQPASSIEDIIGSDSLVAQSQNHVIEFILKWVNYQLCAKESAHIVKIKTEPVCTESKEQDLSMQAKESKEHIVKIKTEPVCTESKKDFSVQAKESKVMNGSVDAVFQENLTASGDTEHSSLGRKQTLGKLLKLVKFSEVSKGTLELLADDDLVMGCKETRDIVRQAMKTVISAPSSATSVTAADSEM